MHGPLTPDEARNGWTRFDLETYREERDAAAGLVGGNVVTEWQKPRPAIRIENTLTFNPFSWRK